MIMLSASKTVFLLFYGIFWGVILSKVGRYRLFETHRLFCKEKTQRLHAWRRLRWGIALIDIVPLVWFLILFFLVVPRGNDVKSVIAAIFASFSLFGFHRILHARIATNYTYKKFYSEIEWKQITEEKHYGERWEPNTPLAHAFFGFIYWIVYPLAGWLIVCLIYSFIKNKVIDIIYIFNNIELWFKY